MAKAAAGVLVVALLLGGCDGGDDSSAEESTSSSSTTTTTIANREAEEQAVIAAYLAQIDAFYAASNPPNPDHSDLPEVTGGQFLTDLRATLADFRDRHIGIRRGELTKNSPVVTRIASNAAVIEDCAVDADVQFKLDSGEVVDDTVVHSLFRARLAKRGGKWKVVERTLEVLDEPCGA